MAVKRTTIFLLERDVRLIRTLQARYGLRTQSDVIRFALRTVMEAAAGKAQPGPRLPGKPAQREQWLSRRQDELAKAQAVSKQAKELQCRVAAYLKHKGQDDSAAGLVNYVIEGHSIQEETHDTMKANAPDLYV